MFRLGSDGVFASKESNYRHTCGIVLGVWIARYCLRMRIRAWKLRTLVHKSTHANHYIYTSEVCPVFLTTSVLFHCHLVGQESPACLVSGGQSLNQDMGHSVQTTLLQEGWSQWVAVGDRE